MSSAELSKNSFESNFYISCDGGSCNDCNCGCQGNNLSPSLRKMPCVMTFNDQLTVMDRPSKVENMESFVVNDEDFPEEYMFDKDIGDILINYDTEQQEDYDFTV